MSKCRGITCVPLDVSDNPSWRDNPFRAQSLPPLPLLVTAKIISAIKWRTKTIPETNLSQRTRKPHHLSNSVALIISRQTVPAGTGTPPQYFSQHYFFWQNSHIDSSTLLGQFGVCLVPFCKNAKRCKLSIWSTKWSLFTKLFAQMGCKSRDESNDAN